MTMSLSQPQLHREGDRSWTLLHFHSHLPRFKNLKHEQAHRQQRPRNSPHQAIHSHPDRHAHQLLLRRPHRARLHLEYRARQRESRRARFPPDRQHCAV
jgi:hypothetical protein